MKLDSTGVSSNSAKASSNPAKASSNPAKASSNPAKAPSNPAKISSLAIKDFVLYKRNQNPTIKKKDALLIQGLTASFEAGKLNAIMGPNGSGKTTMLTALYGLSDRSTKTAGSILLDGKPRTHSNWFSRVSYIEQFPYTPPMTTVRQAIQFSLDLKNDRVGTAETLETHSELIDKLHLSKVLDTGIAVLSGGERQRVAIAADIVAGKDILVMDEPTSDLDSHLALSLMVFLKQLASAGKMVIFTIHQPSDQLVKLFDNVLLMHRGCCVYSGPLSGLDGFLAEHGINRPADWSVSDFIFEAFYNESSFKAINDQKEQISQLLNNILSRAEVTVRSATASNKSTIKVQIRPRLGQTYILLRRAMRLFKTWQFYLRPFTAILFEVFFANIIARILRASLTHETLRTFVVSLFPAPQSPVGAQALQMVDSIDKDLSSLTPPARKLLETCNGIITYSKVISAKTTTQLMLMFIFGSNILFDTVHIKREISLSYYAPASFILAFFIIDTLIFSAYAILILIIVRFSGLWGEQMPYGPLGVFGTYLHMPITIAASNAIIYCFDVLPAIRESIRSCLNLLWTFGFRLSTLARALLSSWPYILKLVLILLTIIELPIPPIHFLTFANYLTTDKVVAATGKLLAETSQVVSGELPGAYKEILSEIRNVALETCKHFYSTATSSLFGAANMLVVTEVMALLCGVVSFMVLCYGFSVRTSLG